MSKLQFQAKIDLKNAVPNGDAWDIQIGFRDGEGVFQGRNIQAGDVLVFNTGVVEPGTYTRYDIVEVKSVSWTGEINLLIRYREDNDNDTPNPPLDYLVGSEGTVSRPSSFLGMLPVISPDMQGMNDPYSFYILNHNLVKVLDQPRDDGPSAEPTRLITAQWLTVNAEGLALLPAPPLGDFVLTMALVFLMDGSIVELLGVTPYQDPETEEWFAKVPASDMTELDGQIGAITVTYLTTSS